MYELFSNARKIYPDLHCIHYNEYGELCLVFLGDENQFSNGTYEMVQQEFIPGSQTDLWFEEAYAYLDQQEELGTPVKSGHYS